MLSKYHEGQFKVLGSLVFDKYNTKIYHNRLIEAHVDAETGHSFQDIEFYYIILSVVNVDDLDVGLYKIAFEGYIWSPEDSDYEIIENFEWTKISIEKIEGGDET